MTLYEYLLRLRLEKQKAKQLRIKNYNKKYYEKNKEILKEKKVL